MMKNNVAGGAALALRGAGVAAPTRGSIPRPAFYAALHNSAQRRLWQQQQRSHQRQLAIAQQASFASLSLNSSRWGKHRHFSSSSRSHDTPRSPFAVFVEVLKEELKKSQVLQENMQQLQGEAGKIQDSEAMKGAKAAYERMRIVTSIKENPRLQAAADQLKKSGGQVSAAVGETLKQMEDSELIKGVS